MQTEYDETVSDCCRLSNSINIVKFKKDDGLNGDFDVKKKHCQVV